MSKILYLLIGFSLNPVSRIYHANIKKILVKDHIFASGESIVFETDLNGNTLDSITTDKKILDFDMESDTLYLLLTENGQSNDYIAEYAKNSGLWHIVNEKALNVSYAASILVKQGNILISSDFFTLILNDKGSSKFNWKYAFFLDSMHVVALDYIGDSIVLASIHGNGSIACNALLPFNGIVRGASACDSEYFLLTQDSGYTNLNVYRLDGNELAHSLTIQMQEVGINSIFVIDSLVFLNTSGGTEVCQITGDTIEKLFSAQGIFGKSFQKAGMDFLFIDNYGNGYRYLTDENAIIDYALPDRKIDNFFLYNGYLYVAFSDSVQLYDATFPAFLSKRNTLNLDNVKSLSVDADTFYVLDNTGIKKVWNNSYKQLVSDSLIEQVLWKGGYAVLIYEDSVCIYDLHGGEEISTISLYDNYRAYIDDNMLYVFSSAYTADSAGFSVFDISDIKKPEFMGRYKFANAIGFVVPRAIAFSDSFLYAAYEIDVQNVYYIDRYRKQGMQFINSFYSTGYLNDMEMLNRDTIVISERPQSMNYDRISFLNFEDSTYQPVLTLQGLFQKMIKTYKYIFILTDEGLFGYDIEYQGRNISTLNPGIVSNENPDLGVYMNILRNKIFGLSIIDIMGREVYKREITLSPGHNSIELPQLSAGRYWICLKNHNVSFILPFIYVKK